MDSIFAGGEQSSRESAEGNGFPLQSKILAPDVRRFFTLLEEWPSYDPEVAKADEVEIVVQILGKIRDKLTIPADSDEATMEQLALASDRIKADLEGKTVRKVIVVKGKLVNIVAN